MDLTDDEPRRLKWYGRGDYGTYWQLERLGDVLARTSASGVVTAGLADLIEAHNVRLFVEAQLYPVAYSKEQKAAATALVPTIKRIVGKYFHTLDDAAFASFPTELPYDYRADLMELMAQYRVYTRCSADAVLDALERTGIGLEQMLTCKPLVQAYDAHVRQRVVAAPRHAETVIQKHFQANSEPTLYLPKSLTAADMKTLLDAYLDTKDANPNYMRLLSESLPNQAVGFDAKMKLKAKKLYARWTENFFATNEGIKSSCEVAIDDGQEEPAAEIGDGLNSKLSYSRRWLEATLDHESILNNFTFLFGFANQRMLLNLPASSVQLGVFERLAGVNGPDFYPVGVSFSFQEQASLMQTGIYASFLRSQDIELENVIAWFFSEYVPTAYRLEGMRYNPSSPAGSYLEKTRNLFSEMESVCHQYELFVEHGEVNFELLGLSGDQLRYREVPSVVEGKYLYPAETSDVASILHLLFSDQSSLRYISEELRGNNVADLLTNHAVSYDQLHEYQQPPVDFLIENGILATQGGRLRVSSKSQYVILHDIYNFGASSYHHLRPTSQAAADEMVARGWLRRESTLLTTAEAGLFNYYLNRAEFKNGPNLRNMYLHGSQPATQHAGSHQTAYLTGLKLLVALVIKINDDLQIRHDASDLNSQTGAGAED